MGEGCCTVGLTDIHRASSIASVFWVLLVNVLVPLLKSALHANTWPLPILHCNTLVRRLQALLRELLIASEDRMALMAGPEFVYIIAALAKLRAAPDQAWLNRCGGAGVGVYGGTGCSELCSSCW